MSELSRRAFLGAAMTVPAAAYVAGCGGGDEPAATTTAPERSRPPGSLRSWDVVREQFDLDPELHHLSAFILAPHSRTIREAIDRHRRGLDRDSYGYRASNQGLETEGVEAAARYLRTAVDRIALTDSTTMGLGIVLGGLQLERGDEILHTAHEHFAARGAIDLAVQRTGARVRSVELYPPTAAERATVKGIVGAIERAIAPATRVVVVTWVHSATGVRLPLREIADAVERKNRGRSERDRALLVVDAAHALGTGPIDIDEAGCDVLIAGCHKWLLGPRGTGLVWARPEAWTRIAPTIPSWSGWGKDNASPGSTMTPGGYHSFEHRWALTEAFDLQESIGPARIAERIAQLGDKLRDGLRRVDGLNLHVPAEPELRSGVVTFSVAGRKPGEVVKQLLDDHRVIASTTPYEVELARLGTCWITTEDEVDAAIAGVREVAA